MLKNVLLIEGMSKDFDEFGGYGQNILTPIIIVILVLLFIIFKLLVWFSPAENDLETTHKSNSQNNKPEDKLVIKDPYLNLTREEIIERIIEIKKQPITISPSIMRTSAFKKYKLWQQELINNPVIYYNKLNQLTTEELKRELSLIEIIDTSFEFMIKKNY